MNENIHINKTISSYYMTVMLFWLAAIVMLVNLGYHNSFLFLNMHYSPLLDPIVPHLTHFGDSLLLSALVIIIIPRTNIPLAFTIVFSILSSGIVLIMLKQFAFP